MQTTITGNLLKMKAELDNPVQYSLVTQNQEIDLNQFIGQPLAMHFKGQINCINCHAVTKKSFAQGYCYNCFSTVPQADQSVLKPELSMAHFGIARDMDYAQQHDLINHFVYLSYTSEIKVGVTRHHQIPYRWIDQGAIQAIKLAETPNRHIAGIIETFLKKTLSDKTNWQTMLTTNHVGDNSLANEIERITTILPKELQKYLLPNQAVVNLNYPVLRYPDKVESLTFDKQVAITGTLTGIKGQYLYIDNEKAINIRKHSGYLVEIVLGA